MSGFSSVRVDPRFNLLIGHFRIKKKRDILQRIY